MINNFIRIQSCDRFRKCIHTVLGFVVLFSDFGDSTLILTVSFLINFFFNTVTVIIVPNS